jgi:hypothetical protein
MGYCFVSPVKFGAYEVSYDKVTVVDNWDRWLFPSHGPQCLEHEHHLRFREVHKGVYGLHILCRISYNISNNWDSCRMAK